VLWGAEKVGVSSSSANVNGAEGRLDTVMLNGRAGYASMWTSASTAGPTSAERAGAALMPETFAAGRVIAVCSTPAGGTLTGAASATHAGAGPYDGHARPEHKIAAAMSAPPTTLAAAQRPVPLRSVGSGTATSSSERLRRR